MEVAAQRGVEAASEALIFIVREDIWEVEYPLHYKIDIAKSQP